LLERLPDIAVYKLRGNQRHKGRRTAVIRIKVAGNILAGRAGVLNQTNGFSQCGSPVADAAGFKVTDFQAASRDFGNLQDLFDAFYETVAFAPYMCGEN